MTSATRLVVCVNKRLGTGQRSCVDSGNLDYIADIESLIEQAGLDVPIVKRECLGKCEWGPVMRIAPGGRFFTEIDESSLPIIIDDLKKFLSDRDKADRNKPIEVDYPS